MSSILLRSRTSRDFSGFPDNIKDAEKISRDPEDLSSLNEKGCSELNAFISKAFLEIVKKEKSEIALIQIAEGFIASEWKQPDGSVIIASVTKSGEVLGAVVRNDGKQYRNLPSIGTRGDSLNTASILACFMALMVLDFGADELGKLLTEGEQEYTSNGKIELRTLRKVSDFVECALENGLAEPGNPARIPVPCAIIGGAVELMTKGNVAAGTYRGKLLAGSAKILMEEEKKHKLEAMKMKEAREHYREIAEENRSRFSLPEERERICSFPDDYHVPKEVAEIVDWYVSSQEDLLPANNFMLRGVTGLGKSTDVELISCILQLPLYRMTCHTNMETGDFLSTLIPCEPEISKLDLPEAEEIFLDPEGAYEKMTGSYQEGINLEEVLGQYARLYASRSSSTCFRRVNSDFVKAMETGAIAEIQEPSRIRDSGVLVGLNEYSRASCLIPLIDGSYVKRHPRALTVWTDNVGYSSCHSMDPSVLRRMSCIIDIHELDRETVIDRAFYNTEELLDREKLESLYDVWEAVYAFSRKNGLEDCDLSPSDLENWAGRVAKIGSNDLEDTFRKCIISKVTSEKELQQEILDTVASPLLDKARMCFLY